jgi:hypothetical protein
VVEEVSKDLEHPENGSIEAGLTMIPATAFFLLGSEGSEFAFEHSRIVEEQSTEIPGGGELLMAKSSAKVPIINSLAPQDLKVTSHVLVVRE